MNQTLNLVFPVLNFAGVSLRLEQLNRKDFDGTPGLNDFTNSFYNNFGTAEDLLKHINDNIVSFSDYGRNEYFIVRSLSTGFFHKEDAIYVFEYRKNPERYVLVDNIDTILALGEQISWQHPVSTWFH